MSFEYRNGVTYTSITDFLENATNGLYKVLADMGWTLHNEVVATSGITDKIYKSTGESGNELIYIRITQVAQTAPKQQVYFRTATYYKSSGTPGANDGNEIGWSSGVPTLFEHDATGTFIGWIYGDKNGVVICTKQDGYYSTVAFGTITRLGYLGHITGLTVTAGSETIPASSTKQITVVSTSGFDAGQKVFIIDRDSGLLLRCTVQSVDDGSAMTVLNDTSTSTTFAANARVGRDPMPTFLWAWSNVYGGYARGCPRYGAVFLYNPATTRFTGTAQAYSSASFYGILMPLQAYACIYTGGQIARDVVDPTSYDEFIVTPAVFFGAYSMYGSPISGGNQLRGYFERLCNMTYGTVISPEDTLVGAGPDSLAWLATRDQSESGSDVKLWAIRTVE